MSALSPIAHVGAQVEAMASPLVRKSDFAGVLRGLAGPEKRQAARAAAQQLVSSTFIMPVLAEMREKSFAAGPFAPDFGQRQFQPLLDQKIADQVTRGANFPLVDVIVNQLLGPEAPGATGGQHGR